MIRDDVVVCENYRSCDTRPVRRAYVDLREPPWCKEGLPMTKVIKSGDWPHRWQS